MGANPYKQLTEDAFWRPTVGDRSPFDINDLWDPKFDIRPDQAVSTYGSCFAQHIGDALDRRGFYRLVTEPAPHGLKKKNARACHYGVFTARTGNIYTTSLLRQWVEWSLGHRTMPDELWHGPNGEVIDPFRPMVETTGFQSVEELYSSRSQTLIAFRESIEQSRYFVFTLGLTESWSHASEGYEYPMCPGTVAGEYDESIHRFRNQQFLEVLKNLREAIRLMRAINPALRFILTVSPVPLTATYSGNNVMVATMESKSILRAVAGQLATNRDYVDYFPSYEMINSPAYGGMFFNPNKRTVNARGVDFVMDSFFGCLAKKFGRRDNANGSWSSVEDAICEEEILEAFGNDSNSGSWQ